MKKNYLFLPVLICFFLFFNSFVFLSCNYLGSSGNEIIPIEGNIVFSIQEIYKNYDSISEPSIILAMSTEKIYPCCNYTLLSEVLVRDNKISVNLSGISIPEIGLTALGPASSSSFLDISPDEYLLDFSYIDLEDKYVVTVTDSSIKIREIESQFTNPRFKLYWRYPPNSFVYLCGTTIETSWMCDDFLDTLLREIDIEEFKFENSGEIPYPLMSKGHYYDMPAKYFYYDKDEDFDKAGEILKEYTKNNITQNSLINWNNKQYLSWLFDN